MKAKQFGFVISIILSLSFDLHAQLNPSTLDHFDELSGTLIYDIMPDQNGELWIASIGGLVKYDGYEYTRFHPDENDSTTIAGILVYTLFEENDGTIWIGGQGNVYSYDPRTKRFKTYNMDEILDWPENAQTMVTHIYSDGKGRIYFGAFSGIGMSTLPGLSYFDKEQGVFKTFKHNKGKSPENIRNLISVNDSTIVVISNNGTFVIDNSGDPVELDIPVSTRSTFLEREFPINSIGDEDGFIWLITNHSRLARISISSWDIEFWDYSVYFEHPVTPRNYAYIIKDDQDRLWFTGEQGVMAFDINQEKFHVIGQELIQEKNLSKMTALVFDDFDNLWVGTRQSGFFKFPNRAILDSYVHHPDDPNSLTEGWINEIFEDSNGILWLPTYAMQGREGLNRLDPITGEITRFLFRDILPGHDHVYMFDEISPGKILFRSNKGIKIYDIETGQVSDSEFDIMKNDFNYAFDLLRDSEGILWLSTPNGVFRMKGKELERLDMSAIETGSQLSNEVTAVIESDRDGHWIQTNDGLFFIDNEDQITRHGYDPQSNQSFQSQDINSLYEDKNGILWVGTWQGGLHRYNPKTREIKEYGIDDGLPSMSIQGILGDEQNEVLWLSTFSGMSRFNIEKEQFNNFTEEDGVQSLLYADGASHITSTGLFVFGGSNGINIFDPKEISQNSRPPLVRITNFNVGGQSFPFSLNSNEDSEIIKLQHDQNNISLDYTGIQFDNPKKNRFAYRLQNFDTDWRDVGTQRFAYYYHLNPGAYSFQVKAMNGNGVWSEPVELTFKITPPWWRTWWSYTAYVILFLLGILSIDRIQRKRLLEKEKAQAKEKELEHAREIEKAYRNLGLAHENLKATQSQLIHSEKMASLGELTAGIAHEIQNPLNFVNNFSEVSSELLEEMTDEVEKGDLEEVKSIALDVKHNLEKINHHGQRASSIVKGMLDHSRASSGERIPTDINALCDEYLRLAYHGLRAKDKSFNAHYETHFDKELPKINIAPQEIGRVILNLINNAFYAVSSKANSISEASAKEMASEDESFTPKVTITTRRSSPFQGAPEGIQIIVKDNGNGIPKDIKDKIFQPFFTTKPTGSGTGLGLSLSYDIVKTHGGEMEVLSLPGQQTEFIVKLPIT